MMYFAIIMVAVLAEAQAGVPVKPNRCQLQRCADNGVILQQWLRFSVLRANLSFYDKINAGNI